MSRRRWAMSRRRMRGYPLASKTVAVTHRFPESSRQITSVVYVQGKGKKGETLFEISIVWGGGTITISSTRRPAPHILLIKSNFVSEKVMFVYPIEYG